MLKSTLDAQQMFEACMKTSVNLFKPCTFIKVFTQQVNIFDFQNFISISKTSVIA